MLKRRYLQLYKININPNGEFLYDSSNENVIRVVRYRTSVLNLLLGKDVPYEFGAEFFYVREIFTLG